MWRSVTQALHSISGLPRGDSTLLAAILRQNEGPHADIASPVSGMVSTLLGEASAGNESAVFFTPAQREAVLRGLFTDHDDALAPGRTALDTDRGWTVHLDLLARLFPDVWVIPSVRHVPRITDPVERRVCRNPLELSEIFNLDPEGAACSRAEAMMAPGGLIGFPLAALKAAMLRDGAERLLLMPYDLLVADPAAARARRSAVAGPRRSGRPRP